MAVLMVLTVMSFFFLVGSIAGLFGRLSEVGELGKEKRAHLTVLKIEGPIMGSEKYLESIQRISEDDNCKGILLRIDSPGGAVGSSQEIFSALKALKTKGRSIVVSQGNLAASGGYYVSLAGDRVFSNPGTLTGSIGVILQFPEASKLMEKVGVGYYTIKSGALKDVGNFSRPPTSQEVGYLQTVIDNTYGQFIDDIVASRKLDREKLLKIADGRVMTGKQALENGLVDTLGGFQEAQNYLAKISHIEGKPIIVNEPPEKSWIEQAVSANSSTALNTFAQVAKELLPFAGQGTFFLWK